MHGNGWKGRLIEASAFIAVAAIAFVGGLLIGDLSASPKTETVLATPSNGGEEAEAPEAPEEAGRSRRSEQRGRSGLRQHRLQSATPSQRPTRLERSAPT